MNDILRSLGRRIREIRIQRGFKSQEEFADYCKMHRTFLGHLETGRKDFRLTTIIRVAQALGVTLQELFAGIESGEPVKPRRITRGPDAQAMLREFAALEKSIQKLRDLACQEPRSVRKKPSRKLGGKKRSTAPHG